MHNIYHLEYPLHSYAQYLPSRILVQLHLTSKILLNLHSINSKLMINIAYHHIFMFVHCIILFYYCSFYIYRARAEIFRHSENKIVYHTLPCGILPYFFDVSYFSFLKTYLRTINHLYT